MATFILTDKILSQMESECLTHTRSLLKTSQSLTDVMEKVIKDCRLVISNILALTDLRDAEDVLRSMQELRALIQSKRTVLQSIIFHKDFDSAQIKTLGATVFMMDQFLRNMKDGTETIDPIFDILEEFERILLVDLKKSEVAEGRCVKYLQDYLRNKTPTKVTRNSAFGNSMANTIPMLISYLKADSASGNCREDSFLRTALLFANLDSLLDKASLHISVWRNDFESDMEPFLETMYKSCSAIKLSLETPKLVNKMYWSFVRNQFLGTQDQKSVLELMYETVQFAEQLPDNSIPVVVTGTIQEQSLDHKLFIVTNKHAVGQGNPAFMFLVNYPTMKLDGKIRVSEEADESNHLLATFHGNYSTLVDFISRNLLNYAAENYLKGVFIGDFAQDSVEPLFDSSKNCYFAFGEEKTMFEDGFPISLLIEEPKPIKNSETEYNSEVSSDTSRTEIRETTNESRENAAEEMEREGPGQTHLNENPETEVRFHDESTPSELERKIQPNTSLRGWHRVAIGPLSGCEAMCVSEDIAYIGVSSPFDLVRLFNQKRNYAKYFSSQKSSLILSPSIRYMSHPKLARFWDDDDYCVQLVLQVRLKSTDTLRYQFPKLVKVPYTEKKLEDEIPNEKMEIKMSADEARSMCEVVGLMIKVHGNDPYAEPDNQWWSLT